jgi:hypothetical protein
MPIAAAMVSYICNTQAVVNPKIAGDQMQAAIDDLNGLTDDELRIRRTIRLQDIARIEIEIAAIRFVEASRAGQQ